VQIDGDAGHEDEVQQPDRAQQNDGLVPGQQVQPVRSDDGAGDDDADEAWHAQPLQDERCDQEDRHGHGDDEDWIGDGQRHARMVSAGVVNGYLPAP
jgi:hypothetical protein